MSENVHQESEHHRKLREELATGPKETALEKMSNKDLVLELIRSVWMSDDTCGHPEEWQQRLDVLRAELERRLDLTS